MKTIAIIDDDIYIGNMLEEILMKEGYGILRAYSGTEALMLLSKRMPDLVLLDLMLPGLSGEQILPKIKNIPVIVVSAKVDLDNKVDLLYRGAVDYITKPFNTKELLARIAVALRNTAIPQKILHFDAITLNTVNFAVSVNDSELKLTRTEYAILKCLMMNSGGPMHTCVWQNTYSIPWMKKIDRKKIAPTIYRDSHVQCLVHGVLENHTSSTVL